MKVTFLGAAKTVTGSCYLIEACGIFFTVDCGMYQGNSSIELRNFETQHYRAEALRFILLTHAHIDHSGLLPRIVREGFKGPIYCTPPTQDLLALMLEDSAHIHEMEAQWKNKKYARNGQQKEYLPLYTIEEAQQVSNYIKSIPYNITFEPYPGIEVTYHDAGHILGAAFIELIVTEHGDKIRLVFSGDLGRAETFLMHPPAIARQADYLFIESTYGDRNHKSELATLDELVEAINYSWENKDKVIIPAFAVGRTQEVLYCLYILRQQEQIPDIPIFLDSPLAIKATELFEKHEDYLKLPDKISFNDMLEVLHIKYTLDVNESKEINKKKGAAIIISASGMCNAGRIKHHLFNNAWRTGVSILFVGYQAIGTLGRKIVDGAKVVRIFNEDIAIKAKIYTLGGFSAHAGQQQLLDWINKMMQPEMNVILVHGEEKSENVLANLIQQQYKLSVHLPDYLEELELIPGKKQPIVHLYNNTQKIDWSVFLEHTENNIQNIRLKLNAIEQEPWETQVEIRDRLLELNQEMESFLMHI